MLYGCLERHHETVIGDRTGSQILAHCNLRGDRLRLTQQYLPGQLEAGGNVR